MRIGASTYSREPFPKQVDEVREAGFDYAELDLTWITWEPEKLRSEADADLRYCLDVGHAHLDKRADGARKYLAVLGDRLGLAHIHDNHGGQGEAGDEHLPFGQGTIDLERDVTALKESGYEGYATLEIFKGIPDDKKACLRKMRRWTREDPS